MQQLIQQDDKLRELFELAQSMPGVGPVTATEVIIATEGFTKFAPNQAKPFARNCGVVPLAHRSGSSIKRRNKTSKKANTKIRTLLTMGAKSCLRSKGELRQ